MPLEASGVLPGSDRDEKFAGKGQQVPNKLLVFSNAPKKLGRCSSMS